MNLKNVFIICGVLGTEATSQQILLSENFSSGIPATWAIVNGDALAPHADVAEFTSGWIPRQTDDSTAASTSYYDPSGQSADYLILPKLSLLSFTKLVWSARSVDASWPDSYYVLLSTTDSLTTNFTDTLLTVTDESYLWHTRSILLDTAGFASQDVFIAFRNFSTDRFILELDDIKVFSDDNAGMESGNLPLISIWPNPAANELHIDHSWIAAEHEIRNMSGQLVLNSNSDNIDVSALPQGIYSITTLSGSNSARSRFLIVR